MNDIRRDPTRVVEQKLGEATVTVYRNNDNTLSLDRVYVEPEFRRLGHATAAVRAVVYSAAQTSQIVRTFVAPDDSNDLQLASKMVKMFMEAGFQPLQLEDGEIYWTDLTYDPYLILTDID